MLTKEDKDIINDLRNVGYWISDIYINFISEYRDNFDSHLDFYQLEEVYLETKNKSWKIWNS